MDEQSAGFEHDFYEALALEEALRTENLMPRKEMERILADQTEHFRDLEAENHGCTRNTNSGTQDTRRAC